MTARSTAVLRPFIWPLVIIILAFLAYSLHIRREMVDFEVYRQAATRALDAEELYRPSDGHYQYKYFPAFAMVMAPFAVLDDEAARIVWFAFSVGMLCALVRWSVRGLPERRRSERVLTWLAVLCMAKFYLRELNLGQTNTLLGLLLVGALLAEQVDQRTAAGALVALGVFVKPYALILVPWLALVAGSAGLLAAGAVLLAGLALPILRYGWQGNVDLLVGWYRTVTDTTEPNLLVPENISVATMWAKWLEPGSTATVLALATALALVALAVVVMMKRRRVQDPGYLEFGLLMLLVPLLSPQGWDYVLVLAFPAVLCVLDRWPDLSRPWRAFTVTTIAFMSFTIFDLLGRAVYTELMALSVVSVAVIGLIVCLAHLRWRALA
jgi:hypothetical protein